MNEPILFIYNIPAPYRVEFLNLLSSKTKIKVIFENENSAHRKKEWLTNKKNFNHLFINSSFISYLKVLWEVTKSNKIVLGGYSTRFSIFLVIYMKLLRKKFILNADGGFVKKDNFFIKYFKKFLISSATYWISSGNETNRYLLNYGAKKENIYIYPFTSISKADVIAPSKTEKNKIKSHLLNTDKNVVLYVGSFIPIKGIEKLILAANSIPDTIFLFIGDVPSVEQKILVKDNNNIIFINHLSKNELSHYYKIADLFVFPTQGDVWGLVINEAVANNLPIITTNRCIAGIEIVDEDMGRIVPYNIEPQELAETIKCSLSNLDKYNYTKIKNKAEEYTLEKMCESHLDIFKKIFGRI